MELHTYCQSKSYFSATCKTKMNGFWGIVRKQQTNQIVFFERDDSFRYRRWFDLKDSGYLGSTCKLSPILEMEDTIMPSGFMMVWHDLELSRSMLQMVTVDSPASFWWLETDTPPVAGKTTLALPRHFRILKSSIVGLINSYKFIFKTRTKHLLTDS